MMFGKRTAFVLQLFLLAIDYSSSQELVLNLNTKRIVASTSEKFLSLTLDPADLLTGDVLSSSTERSTNMAKALAPGYVRLAGPKSNSFTFERSLFPQNTHENESSTFSEAHWVLVQQWAARAGLDVISCLAPSRIEVERGPIAWDSRNTVDLISFSDNMGYNLSWQLGYECQARCQVEGSELGKDVHKLRNILATFPRYSNSIIAGPDILDFKSKDQQQYIQDYLNAAGNALSVVTWHPDFAGISMDSDGVELQTDTIGAEKELLYRTLGRSIAKKPLWIAESKTEVCKKQFLGALVWARRLGSAARIGAQVIMRKPDTANLFQPTPDYWVSLLHKMLVGKEVLDTKLLAGNKSHVHFYCQCTKPSAKYDKGAITIFGLNLTPNKVSVTLKGLRIKALHKYILMPGYDTANRMFAETVLLNNEPLDLVDGRMLPEINPAVVVLGKNVTVKLPSGGIGFWVIPGARMKLCMGHETDTSDKNLLMKLAKKLEEPEQDENVGQEIDEDGEEAEADDSEDARNFLRSRKTKKRKHRYSEENEKDERKIGKIDAKKELEKFERLLKRHGSYIEERRNSNLNPEKRMMVDESSEEGEQGLVQFKNNMYDSEEKIRHKSEEYKNKLIEHEYRRRNQEDRRTANKDNNNQRNDRRWQFLIKSGTSPEEAVDEDKDVESIVRNVDIEKIVADGVEETRVKRDLDKLRGEDLLGLKREGLFKKRIVGKDDAKERRLERLRYKKKDKDEILYKKELPVNIYNPKATIGDSSENNFFGFPNMKPLENFPEGDLHLATGDSTEGKNEDYDYVREDDEEDVRQRNEERRRLKSQKKHEDTTWLEDPSSHDNHVPKEFFENLKAARTVTKKDLKDYSEMWEVEALQRQDDEVREEPKMQGIETIVSEGHADEEGEKRAKETTMRKLTNYYGNSDVMRAQPALPYDMSRARVNKNQAAAMTDDRSRGKSTRKSNFASTQDLRTALDLGNYDSTDPGSMQFVSSNSEDYSRETYEHAGNDAAVGGRKKPKRQVLAIGETFDKEMIREEVANPKDSKSRVIRQIIESRPNGSVMEDEPRVNSDALIGVEAPNISEEERTANGAESPERVSTIVAAEDPRLDQSSIRNDEPIANESKVGMEDGKADDEIVGVAEFSSRVADYQNSITMPSGSTDTKYSTLHDADPPFVGSALPENSEVTSSAEKSDVNVIDENEGSESNLNEKTPIVEDTRTDTTAEASEAPKMIVGSKMTEQIVEDKETETSSPAPGVKSKLLTKSDSILKNKLGSSTSETFASLIKDKELAKSLESSSKLKSMENAKLQEYQKKRDEKLSSLKEKLKARKGKILQQYRQELVEALNKCDEEVEKNLKRREIWEKVSEQEDLADFVDQGKLEYLMTNRPVNYDANGDETSEENSEDKRYYSNVELLQPTHHPRQPKINPSASASPYIQHKYPMKLETNRRYPIFEDDYFPGLQDPSEFQEPRRDNDGSSYYALVDSIEAPRILPKNNFQGWYATKDRYVGDGEDVPVDDYDKETHENPLSRSHSLDSRYRIFSSADVDRVDGPRTPEDEPAKPRIYRVKTSNLDNGKPILASRDLETEPIPIWQSYPKPDANRVPSQNYDYYPPRSRTKFRNGEVDAYQDEPLYHRRRQREQMNADARSNFGTKMTDREELTQPKRIGLDMRARHEVDDETVNDEAPVTSPERGRKDSHVRHSRNCLEYSNENLRQGDAAVRLFWDPSEISSSRIGRDTGTGNYVCLKKDSGEVSTEDEEKLYKIVKTEDHYEAVPVLKSRVPEGFPFDDEGMSRQGEKQKSQTNRKDYEEQVYLKSSPKWKKSSQPKSKRRVEEFFPDHGVDLPIEYADKRDERAARNGRKKYYEMGDVDERRPMEHGYELLMLIPVKHGVKRNRREIGGNAIDREGNDGTDMNQVWRDLVMIKNSEQQLRDYMAEKEQVTKEFAQAQRSVNVYLKKIKSVRDPVLKKELEKIILNVDLSRNGTKDASPREQLEQRQIGEYLKQEIVKQIHSGEDSVEPPEQPSFLEKLIPEVEKTVEEELVNVSKLTASLEEFIDDFEANKTASGTKRDEESDEFGSNILGAVLNHVQNFFDFLTGVVHVFHRY